MANEILFREGFDTYDGVQANIGLQSKWTSSVPSCYTTVPGRFGGSAVRYDKGGGTLYPYLRGTLDANSASDWACGFALRVPVLGAANNSAGFDVRFLGPSATYELGLRWTILGEIQFYRITSTNSGTLLATSDPGVLISDEWTYLECECVMSNTVGEFRTYQDGNPTPVLSVSAADTITTNNSIRYIDVGCSSVTAGPDLSDYDDMYFKNTATRLGPRRILTLAVDGDSTPLNWTPLTGTSHYPMVDEIPANVADYIRGSAVGDVDRFTFAGMTVNPLSIDEVNVICYAQKNDAATRAIDFGLTSSGNDSTKQWYLQTAWGRNEFPVALDPNGGIAWTRTAVNAALGKVEVTV